jgi:imidazolonepropionase-like amidohydrolase
MENRENKDRPVSIPRNRAKLLLCLWTGLLAWGCGVSGDGSEHAADLAITNVTVIQDATEEPVRDATVLVEDGLISAVGSAGQVEVPSGATTVDGSGRYLIAGLFDMHAHLSKTRGSSLNLFVASGVTTVRDMGGDLDELLRWRKAIRSGDRIGPRILLAGPYLEASANVERMRGTPPGEMVEPVERTRVPVGSPERARHVVDSLAALGVDYLKIRTVEDRATYLALNRAADARGLDLVGHTFGLPPELVVEAGQDAVEHFLFPTLDSLSRQERMSIWSAMADSGVAVVPTLVTFTRAVFPPTDSLRAMVYYDSAGTVEPRRRYLSRYLELDWKEQLEETSEDRRAIFRDIWSSTLRNLRELHEAGVAILPGTDAAVLNVFPGSALHEEIALLVQEVRMTPADALARATRLSAEHLGVADSVGTVEVGKVADLVLLDGNPLEDVRSLSEVDAVVLRGELFTSDDLEALLAATDTARDQHVNDWPR